MPIYEYQCKACGHKLEKLQRISDSPLTDCPSCDAPELNKLVSAAAFRLKGSGWYETDFKTGKKRNVIGGDKAGTSTSSSDDSGGGSSTGSSDSSAAASPSGKGSGSSDGSGGKRDSSSAAK